MIATDSRNEKGSAVGGVSVLPSIAVGSTAAQLG
jgi:hypothetical protein